MTTAQEVRRSPRLERKEKVRYEGYHQARNAATVRCLRSGNSNISRLEGNNNSVQPSTPSSSTSTRSEFATGGVVGLTKDETDAFSGSKSDHNTKFDTLLATMTEGEKVLASFKRNVIAYRDSAVDLDAKLQVAETELKESAAAFREELAYLILDVEARDDEIARLKQENDELKKEKLEIERLGLESTMDKQAARLRELEDLRKQMRKMLIGGEARL